ncbi:MAG: hypothetical protein IJ789_05095 [Bacteroidales bacterium]|nr:hypothetical protein [Bacteroidales bacterium]MBR1850732.1 hypothetical protein [Bacteroidales bacterium]
MKTIKNIKRNPFAQYSAEEELDALKEYYYEQQYYQELVDLAKEGVSRFVLGQRGQGKSATIYHLFDDLQRNKILPVLITRYDNIPENNNENYFLYSIIQGITFGIAKELYVNKKLRSKLNKSQKTEIAILIEAFYDQQHADEFLRCSKGIATKRRKNALKRIWNVFLKKPVNSLISAGVQVSVQLIQSYAGVTPDFSIVGHEYFEGFKIEEFQNVSREKLVSWPTERLIKIIHNMQAIAEKLGHESIVILFDKIDEVKDISTDINKVAEFIFDLLSDTDLLYTNKLSIVMSLWSEIKKALNQKGVRFDKFKEIDIRWRNEELAALINKRLTYFSIDKSNSVSFQSLLPNKDDQTKILKIADGSPRSLITLLSYIINEESETNDIVSFSSSAIYNGCLAYCKKFDYYSQQPVRTGKNSDIINWINRLLRMKLTSFSIRQYSDFFKVSNLKTAQRHINDLIKYNLVKDSLYPASDGTTLYEVVDPRINYLIVNGIVDL